MASYILRIYPPLPPPELSRRQRVGRQITTLDPSDVPENWAVRPSGTHIEQFERTLEEFENLREQVNDNSGESLVCWLRRLAESGLRNPAGKHILLDVQKRGGVEPADMDQLRLEEADALAKIWARVRREHDHGEVAPVRHA